jgi:hypothetical protein
MALVLDASKPCSVGYVLTSTKGVVKELPIEACDGKSTESNVQDPV